MTKEQLINRRFGKWVVIDVVGTDLHYKTARCNCVCDCGTKRDVSMHCLLYKQSTSCGCQTLGKFRPRNVIKDAKVNALYAHHKSASKVSRGIEFALTPEEFYSIVTKPCTYCGGVSAAKLGMGVDRVDNSKGYILDNCVPCCKQCNKAKNILTVQEFYDHIKKIHEFQQLKLGV